jgi:cytochrome c oxidase subunit 2
MEKQKPSSLLTPIAFAVLLILLTVSTIYYFAARTWWFPPAITQLGHELDAQFTRTLWITGLVFFLSQLGLGWAVFRYRDRGQRAQYSHGNLTLEVLWTVATAVMFVGLGIAAERGWAEFHFQGASPGALQIEVTGQQFAWNFRYAGADGQFGRTDTTLINDSTGNPLGLDTDNDPAARDDIVLPTMTVPANREVELTLRSKDVTHGFFVRELRFKQDTVPGMIIKVHFTATQPGTYELACAELCGLGHHRMRSVVHVLPPEEFDRWLAEQQAQAVAGP